MKLLSLLFASSAVAAEALDAVDVDFADYVQQFGLEIADDEYAAREATFLENVAAINTHNAESNASWTMGINQFTHLTAEEFGEQVATGYNKNFARQASGVLRTEAEPEGGYVEEDLLPKSVDWRTKKPAVLSAVKNQLSCGSCWAFSATESTESHLAIKTGKVLVLSPQQLVDCAPNPDHCGGTGGCDGSTCPLAFNYSAHSAGLLTDKQYPYKAETNKCAVSGLSPVATIDGYVSLPTNNYLALLNAIQKQPVSISVAASAWGTYQGGIFDDSTCGTDINHAVQLVGYGVEKGTKYWIVRNSWGTTWGEDGYIRVKRYSSRKTPCAMDTTPQDGYACEGQTQPLRVCGLCGILSDSSYPTGGKLL